MDVRLTPKQIEQVVDILKSVGLAVLIGSGADAVVVGGRYMIDGIGFIGGFVTLTLAVRLTRRLNGGSI